MSDEDELIPMINRLQAVSARVCMYREVPLLIHLPQIAIVGCHGTEKYRILENIVGRLVHQIYCILSAVS